MTSTETARRPGARLREGKQRIVRPKERRSILISQDVDAVVVDRVQKGENTYSGLVEAALRKYLGADAHSTVA